ncbi:MAG: hypothetical protein CL867_06620 [Cytophagaceae bacterium]|nr:hypothetical protein [Cytophagaceae bacterium]
MRDFEGFLATPTLWKGSAYGLTQFEFPSINLECFTPKAIPHKLRLGHRVEHIFTQLLDHSERYHILGHNIQIKHHKQTLGELDFIVKDNLTAQVIHIELSYKFYVVIPSNAPIEAGLIGPNRKDAFLTKISKTREKQLPLLYSDQARHTLSTLGLSASQIIQNCYFCAQLFVPYRHLKLNLAPFDTLHIKGYWVQWSDFCTSAFRSLIYYIPQKSEWIQEPHDEVAWKTHTEITSTITVLLHNQRAPLLWIKKASLSFEKCFVVWW